MNHEGAFIYIGDRKESWDKKSHSDLFTTWEGVCVCVMLLFCNLILPNLFLFSICFFFFFFIKHCNTKWSLSPCLATCQQSFINMSFKLLSTCWSLGRRPCLVSFWECHVVYKSNRKICCWQTPSYWVSSLYLLLPCINIHLSCSSFFTKHITNCIHFFSYFYYSSFPSYHLILAFLFF